MSDLDLVLAAERLIDLTQPLGPATVLWPGSRAFVAETTVDHDTHGCYARDLELPEHAGTHVDAPAHFARDGATAELIPLDRLVRPAVRLDVRDSVGEDASYAVTAEDVSAIERRDGEIPASSASSSTRDGIATSATRLATAEASLPPSRASGPTRRVCSSSAASPASASTRSASSPAAPPTSPCTG